jgi:3-deoxy-D-manno-octulosonic-acid transferase
VIYALYTGAISLALLGYLPAFLLRRLGRGGYGRDLAQRVGRLGPGLPPEPRCWVHAVSVGEAAAVAPLVEAIRGRWPELSVVLTTVTPTGARVAAERLPGAITHRYFPLDLPGSVGRALEGVRPRFFIGMETELWPNFLRGLARRGIPAMIANGRVSDRSFRRYRWVRFLMARVLQDVTVFGMQSAEDARRIIALGAPPERVVVTGNLKSDLPPEDTAAARAWQDRLGRAGGDLVWVAGSTHRGEEDLVLEAFGALRARFPALRLVLAPRHPERAGEVERRVQARGLKVVRRTALGAGPAAERVLLLDTVGELADLYEAADLAFVGGSLIPVGGHNMLEPAARRRPVLFGPHTENFREAAELLLAAGAAALVRDAQGLADTAGRLLADPELRARMGAAGRAAVSRRQGALARTLDLVQRFLWCAESPAVGPEHRPRG